MKNIGTYAFYNCSNLEKVNIPTSLKIISEGLFKDCDSLEIISIPDGIVEIQDFAFEDTQITEIVIPDSVSRIGEGVLEDCASLSTIVTPYLSEQGSADSTIQHMFGTDYYSYQNLSKITLTKETEIQAYAFSNCKNCTTISIPDDTTKIGAYAFKSCDELANFQVPNALEVIEEGAFYDCDSITSIALPESLVEIYDRAFKECGGITEIVIPDHVEYLGEGIFEDCYDLVSLVTPHLGEMESEISTISHLFGSTQSYYMNLQEITITKDTVLQDYAFSGARNLQKVILPEGLTSIGKGAFSSCTDLTAITLPSTVVSIKEEAFSKCDSLTSISLPLGLDEIGNNAFDYCNNLESIVIPDSVTYIGEKVFANCSSLAILTAPYLHDDSSYGNTLLNLFGDTRYCYLEKITLTKAKTIQDGAFAKAYHLREVVLPDTVTSIGTNAFYDCDSLASIRIPKSVKTIGNSAFESCNELTAVFVYNKSVQYGTSVFDESFDLTVLGYPGSTTEKYITKYYADDDNVQFKDIQSATYQITYVLDGGINNPANKSSFSPYESIHFYDPTKAGNTFAGWYKESSFRNKVTDIPIGTFADYKVYAKWTKHQYTISYNANGGSGSMSSRTCVYGTEYTLAPCTMSKKGEVFLGWNTKANGTGTYYADRAKVKNLTTVNGATVVLYAQWGTNATYQINYVLNCTGVTNSNPTTYTSNTETIVLVDPSTRAGYKFAGWYKEKEFKTKVTEIKKGSNGDITLYAKWVAITYTVHFSRNGGSSATMDDFICTYGKNYVLPASTYTRYGYTFYGWNTKADGTGKAYEDEATIKNLKSTSGTVNLYAQWKPIAYIIHFTRNGGTGNMTDMTCEYGKTYTLPISNVTKIGYTFAGWNTKADGSGKSFADGASVQNLTGRQDAKVYLYAQWTPITYKVHFSRNGGTGEMSDVSYVYGEYYVLPKCTLTRKGYVFAGWNTKADGSGVAYADGAKVKNLIGTAGVTRNLFAQWKPAK